MCVCRRSSDVLHRLQGQKGTRLHSISSLFTISFTHTHTHTRLPRSFLPRVGRVSISPSTTVKDRRRKETRRTRLLPTTKSTPTHQSAVAQAVELLRWSSTATDWVLVTLNQKEKPGKTPRTNPRGYESTLECLVCGGRLTWPEFRHGRSGKVASGVRF